MFKRNRILSSSISSNRSFNRVSSSTPDTIGSVSGFFSGAGFDSGIYKKSHNIKDTIDGYISKINEHLEAIDRIQHDEILDTKGRLENKINRIIEKSTKESDKDKLHKAKDVMLQDKQISEQLSEMAYADLDELTGGSDLFTPEEIKRITLYRPLLIKKLQDACDLSKKIATSLIDIYYDIIWDAIWQENEGLSPVGFSRI